MTTNQPIDTTSRRHFTRAEHEILECLAGGMDKDECAEYVGLSVKTLSWHLQNVYKKLNVSRMHQALIKSGYLVRGLPKGFATKPLAPNDSEWSPQYEQMLAYKREIEQAFRQEPGAPSTDSEVAAAEGM